MLLVTDDARIVHQNVCQSAPGKTKCLIRCACQEVFLQRILPHVVHFSIFSFSCQCIYLAEPGTHIRSLAVRNFSWCPTSNHPWFSGVNSIWLCHSFMRCWSLFCKVHFLLILAYLWGFGMYNEKPRCIQKVKSVGAL